MWKLLVLAISLVGAFAAEETKYQNPPNNTQAAEVQAPPQVPPQVPPTKPGVKNITAGGRYHDGHEYGHEHGGREYGHGHGGHEYGHGHHGHHIFRGYNAPLIDDYICDLDATILVVTNSEKDYGHDNNNNYGRTKREAYGGQEYGKGRDSYGPSREYGSGGEHYGRDNYEHRDRDNYGPHREHYGREYGHHHDRGYDRDHHDRGYDRDHHGYGNSVGVSANADRLRCSVIASLDREACTSCCRLSARRDRSISKHKIIGFLVDNNQLNYDSQAGGGEGYADNYSARKKRSEVVVPANYNQNSGPSYEVPDQEGDYRCVCCAPKRYRPFIFDRYSRRHHHHYGGHEGPY
jgi:hypothetical protein